VLSRAVDRRVARGAALALVVLVVAALAAAVVRAGGPADFFSARWHEFSNKISAQVPQNPNRIISASSSNRWRWWTEAWNAFTDKPLQGNGAGTFELIDRVERNSPLATTEPHSVPLQFLTETGIVGFLLYAVVVASAVIGILRRERTRAWLALALGAAVCFAHSFVDIDWDFIAVQGPLFLTLGALVSGPATPIPARRWLVSAAVGVCALAAMYSLASPWLAANRVAAAYAAIESNHPGQALTDARSAHAFNPLSVDALTVQALVEPDYAKALQLYRRARDLEPMNPETWYQLGAFELFLKRPRDAYRDLNQSYTLDNTLFGPKTLAGHQLDQARCKIDPATCP
jgi:tetratricopeptide (TPR) repeat protein